MKEINLPVPSPMHNEREVTADKATLAPTDVQAVFREIVAVQHDASVEMLREWIALPTLAQERLNVSEGAEHMATLLKESGFQRVKIVPTNGLPGVFGTLDAGASKWLGIYFMYDVMPFDTSKWSSPPLEGRIVHKPSIGKVLIGRGAENQKGPQAAFLAAIRAVLTSGRKLPVNIALVAEGEEEIGSPNFRQVTEEPEVLAALRKCIGVVVPELTQTSSGSVSVVLGSKGTVEFQLIASGERWGRGPTVDIHSMEAPRVDSPAWHLIKALTTLVEADGHTPAIDGWFENVKPLTDRQRDLISQTARITSEEDAMTSRGIKHWFNDEDYRAGLERLASQPTINLQGLIAGYTGPGGMSILPARAEAKFDLRLVPDQTTGELLSKLNTHLRTHGFGDIEVNVTGGYDPTEIDEDTAIIRAQRAVLTRVGVEHTLVPRAPGSWPGVIFTARPLNVPACGFGLGRGGNLHAPDEFIIVESTDPKVAGFDEATIGFIEYLYQIACEE
ncbi:MULTISPECIES: M20/M25/M40 family metallo-hydrolase [unclassified Mesorhizobium]|uniref:M20/M25/M40 family metallo-hydrolase n=1 Tax=unclassified Mesorhizobium TaxID=325217 RepID=UPI00040F68D2